MYPSAKAETEADWRGKTRAVTAVQRSRNTTQPKMHRTRSCDMSSTRPRGGGTEEELSTRHLYIYR